MLKFAIILLASLTAYAQKPGSRPVPVPDPVTRPQDYRFYKEQQYKQLQQGYQRQFTDSYSKGNMNNSADWVNQYNRRQELQKQYSQDFSNLTQRLNPGSPSSSGSSYPSTGTPSYGGSSSAPSVSSAPSSFPSSLSSTAPRYAATADGAGWQNVVNGESTTTNVAGADVPKGATKYRFGQQGVEFYPDPNVAQKLKQESDAAAVKMAAEQKTAQARAALKLRYTEWGVEQTANNQKWIRDQLGRLKESDNVWASAKVRRALVDQDTVNQGAVKSVLGLVESGKEKDEIEAAWKAHVGKLAEFPAVDDLYEAEDARYPLTVKEPAGCAEFTIVLNRDGTATVPKMGDFEGLKSVVALGKHCLIIAKQIDWKEPGKKFKTDPKLVSAAILLEKGKFVHWFVPANEKTRFVKVGLDEEKKNFLMWHAEGEVLQTLQIDILKKSTVRVTNVALPTTAEFFE